MKIFLMKVPIVLLSVFFFTLTILPSVLASISLKDEIRKEVNNNPFLKKQNIKLKVKFY